ncbi:hypothetical protein [Ruminococcus sp.]|uniref:hypothetical protein n=1 Tax=Ruminococcus sp. TaxID=41978 RepID=UPI003F7E4FFB
MNIINNVFEKSNDFFQKHLIFTNLVVRLSSIWFSFIVNFLGNDWLVCNIVDSNNNVTKQFTALGWGLTVIVVLASFYVPFIEKWNLKNGEQEKLELRAENYLLNEMNNKVSKICKQKCENQLELIKSAKKDKDISLPKIYTHPCKQLELILNSFKDCLKVLITDSSHNISDTDLSINMFYNFPKESGSWKVVNNQTTIRLPIERIINENSTFNYLLNSNEPYVIFNSKQIALEEKHYIRDALDHTDSNNKLKGSIACFRLDFGDFSGVYIKSVIAISTVKMKFIEENKYYKYNKENEAKEKINEDSKNLAESIEDKVINNFKDRFGVELFNYYIQFLYNKKYSKKLKLSKKINN